MEDFDSEIEHPRKRRRRMESKKPLSARLILDENLRGDAAALSPDLWSKLVSERKLEQDSEPLALLQSHVAVAPWTPFQTSVDEAAWTVISVRKRTGVQSQDANVPNSTVFISPESSACQSFLRTFEIVDHGRHGGQVSKGIDVRVVDVDPVSLDIVYVTVEKGLLEKVDDIQSKFGGGFHHAGRHTKTDKKLPLVNSVSKSPPETGEDRMTSLVRGGLSQLSVLHAGDIFSLPLPAHPITHVPAPPAMTIGCEPVNQGILSQSTKIILVQAGSSQEKAIKQLRPAEPIIEESIEDTAEDTSNDQFYSAAEDRQSETSSDLDGVISEGALDSEDSEDHTDDASDDSMDDMISLSAPGLPPTQSGTLSALTAATPRPGLRRPTGVHTPGSVYSTFTSTTARPGTRPGKVFRSEPLLRKLPHEALHPRPAPEDDEEAFVFVDTSTLAKIGCFSGDWVRVEAAKNMSSQAFPSLGFGGLGGLGEDDADWRAVRIFGLSGLPNQRPRYVVNKSGDRKSSFSQSQPFSLTPSLYLSPILLSNMGNARFIKVGVLPKFPTISNNRILQPQPKPSELQAPPLAKDVTLLKVSTPLSTSRDLQPVLFSGLKRYFECKRRVLKRGDLIAIAVDEELARATFSPANNAENGGIDDDIATKLGGSNHLRPELARTAWFRVDQIATDSVRDVEGDDYNIWGGAVTIDSSNTRMSQAGSRLQSISETTVKNAEYWSGSRIMPKQSMPMSTVLFTASDLPNSQPLPLEKRLRDLITAATSPRAINLGLPPLVILLHSTQRQIGKTYTAKSACAEAGIHTFVISGHDLLSENASTTGGGDVKTEALLKSRAERALASGSQYTALLIQHIDVLTADRMAPALQEIVSTSRVLIATTTELDKIPPGVRSLFTHELELSAPNEDARQIILQNACLSLLYPISPDVSLKSLALQTAALVAGDLVDVVNRAGLARSRRLLLLAQSHHVTVSDLEVAGGNLISHILQVDFASAIAAARATFSDAIGAPKIPTVTWADVGGLASQKDTIMETISLPLTRPELFANGIRKRSGILFYGPPGTGKTLLAKAIATEFHLNFFSVKGPELLNMYIGESEANVRRVFQRARDARPCVVFFDELDSVAPKRGNQGDSGGVMDRIVSQLLAELDGMSSGGSGADGSGEDQDSATNSGGGVFVIGATNRPDLLDPALLRPGRFDKMLYLGVANTHDQQLTIMQALTRKFTLAPEVNLPRVAERLPFTYTGADLYALCSDAMLKAITRKTREVDVKVQELSHQRDGEEVTTGWFFDHLATEDDVRVVVNEEDFINAQRELVGSVSAKELEHFERIRSLFEADSSGSGKTEKSRGKGEGGAVAGSARLPVRPAPNPSDSSTSNSGPARASILKHDLEDSPSISRSSSQVTVGKGKNKVIGKGKNREHPASHSFSANNSKGKPKIANPDSGPDVSDESSDEVDEEQTNGVDGEFGSFVPQAYMNGSANGLRHKEKGTHKGKGKEREKAVTNAGDAVEHTYEEVGDKHAEFAHGVDVEGDDEGLYS